jgi:hypothetical protein
MLPETINGQAPLPVPETSPVTLDELLSAAPCSIDRTDHHFGFLLN